MARLHEYQAKEILRAHGIGIPQGRLVRRGEEWPDDLPDRAVVKAQAWTTSRLAQGLIQFCDSVEEVRRSIEDLSTRSVNGFPVTEILVEDQLTVESEYFFSYFIDDEAANARFLFAPVGGSGVEETLRDRPEALCEGAVEPWKPVRPDRILDVLRHAELDGTELQALSQVVYRAIRAAIETEARSLEINPIVRTAAGTYVAADCRLTVDDYAVFRHPELGIEIARDLANPPTDLDRVAYAVERDDYRGTFYFTQLSRGFSRHDRYVGFHGAGGGGSMMSMDALSGSGLRAANYCDTSGNPAASKVYRAARIILSQPSIVGYFGSGSGVASQEQVHSARGLVKAFRETGLAIPAVLRLGGNMEDEAIQILEHYTRDLSAPVRGFGKDTSVVKCAETLSDLVSRQPLPGEDAPASEPRPDWLGSESTYRFDSATGSVSYHLPTCLQCSSKACISTCVPQILVLRDGKPELAISREDARAGKCIECLACEVECREHGNGGGYVDLPIPGIESAVP